MMKVLTAKTQKDTTQTAFATFQQVNTPEKEAVSKTLDIVGAVVGFLCILAWGFTCLMGTIVLFDIYGGRVFILSLLASVGSIMLALYVILPMYDLHLRAARVVFFLAGLGTFVSCIIAGSDLIESGFYLTLFAELALGIISYHIHNYSKKQLGDDDDGWCN